ncbi:MAG: hypothetical protein CUN49_02445 [Candidatus Thermofonsia Clade 1 bacterium]|uniref:Thioredoxin domain-containing protein n=1 Tax=Candidatus Thermofonsia Clade 1 bacterium TaxID=2364210 RepID=A0A2M8PHK3_9CHLR|nr:MAG: hypothetical protein CUN49_02445 [Candidatus Thermofonsia Clade 1 bacterium]
MAWYLRRVARQVAAALLTLLAFALIAVAGLPEQRTWQSLPQNGALILAGRTLDGDSFQLSAWRGLPIILNFWASWCAPCREELPALQQLHASGFRVVGVNVGEPSQQALGFAMAHGVTFPNLLDPDYYWLRVFGVRTLPTTFFISADGALREIVQGGMSADELFRKARALDEP